MCLDSWYASSITSGARQTLDQCFDSFLLILLLSVTGAGIAFLFSGELSCLPYYFQDRCICHEDYTDWEHRIVR